MIAAPLSIVAMRISCPGQSTNDTCLETCIRRFQTGEATEGAEELRRTLAPYKEVTLALSCSTTCKLLPRGIVDT